MCTCLAWNELDANILAIGHDRHRNDTCITIWDIERGVPKETANFFGVGESANSICWDRNHRTVIAGMSQKMIKLFDLRREYTLCDWLYFNYVVLLYCPFTDEIFKSLSQRVTPPAKAFKQRQCRDFPFPLMATISAAMWTR